MSSRRRSGLRFGGRRRRGFSNPFAGLIVGPFLVVFGAILLILGWGWYSKTAGWAAAGGTAMGTVVEMKQYEKTTDNGTTIMYQPVIVFRTETGEEITYTDPTSTSSPRHQIGDQVEIVYDRNFPTYARQNNFWSLHLPDAIVMGAGGFFLLMGLMGLIGGIRSLVLAFAAGGIAAYLLAKKKGNEEQDQLQV